PRPVSRPYPTRTRSRSWPSWTPRSAARTRAESRSRYSKIMAVNTLIPVEEYLNTSYDPDVEYVDGVLVERNVGDYLHSLVQGNLILAFSIKYPHVKALPELRSKTQETRYRLPDVCVLLAAPNT